MLNLNRQKADFHAVFGRHILRLPILMEERSFSELKKKITNLVSIIYLRRILKNIRQNFGEMLTISNALILIFSEMKML